MPPSQAPRLKRPIKTTIAEPAGNRPSRRQNSVCGAMLAFFASVIWDYLGIFELVPLFRDITFLSLIFLAVGAWLGARSFKVVLAFAIGTALLLLTVAYTPLSSKMATPLQWRTTPDEIARGADAIMVLGSWVQKDETFTGPAMTRLLRGMELARQKRAPIILVSEIAPPAGSYAKAARRLASNLEITLNVQPLPGYVRNTRDEAVHFAKLAKSKGWKRVLLVTSPTHTRRSTLMFRRAAQGQNLKVMPVPSMELDADLSQLSDPGERINVFKWSLREIVGLWIYQRRGWV